MQFLSVVLGASALIAPVFAQTFTDCNPLHNTTCPNNPGFGIDHTFDFNDKKDVIRSFNITNGVLDYGKDGTEFTIHKQGQSPTIRSKFYIHFGSISVVMKAAKGQGIVSSIVIQSECLDEIDWEFLGGNATHAQTNYFGKGDTTTFDRDIWHPVDTDVRDNFHNYTVDWTKEKMDFYIDSKFVRTLPYGAANGGKNYPQTPSTVRLGIWAGGDVDNNGKGTVEWAGGETDFSKAPFSMYVKSTSVKDYSTGKEYTWSDQTGNWQSIKAIPGESVAAQAILKNVDPVEQTPVKNADNKSGGSIAADKSDSSDPSKSGSADKTTGTDAASAAATESGEPDKSIGEKFSELPQTSKVAIYAGAGGGAAVIFAAFMFICIRQRRKGRNERDAYNNRIEKEREDAYRDQMELRNKGLGGWDQNTSQGEDALGGWQSRQSLMSGATPPVPKVPTHVAEREMGSSPVSRTASPAAWNGGNSGGMIHNAQNSYTGGYTANRNIPTSPNFPLASQSNHSDYGFPSQQGFPTQPQNNGFGRHGGYSRF